MNAIAQQAVPPDSAAPVLISIRDVEARVGLKKSVIYAMMAEGRFPRPVKIGTRSRWVESEISAWIADLIARRNVGRGVGSSLAASAETSA